MNFALLLLSLALTPVNAESILHTPARNQHRSEFCWAYSISGMIEGMALERGVQVQLSPEYLGFYHLYFELYDHLKEYRIVARHLEANRTSGANEAQQEFERILKRDQDLLPEQGAWFDTALKLLGTVGTVPVDSFREAIRDSATFQNDLTNFIRNVMFKERNLDRFEPLDDSGLNRELFESLGQALGMTPPLPTEQIHYRSSQYTPQEFLRDYLKINPSDFRTPFFTSRNLDSAIRQIQDAVQKGQAVPIALSLFEGSPANGVFSCTPTKPCQKIDGGHAMLIVKLHQDKTGQVDGFIVKNSWGDMGLNDRGRPTATESQRGFFLITRDYLVQSSRRGKFQLVLPAQP